MKKWNLELENLNLIVNPNGKDKPKSLKDIKWTSLGFPEVTSDDSTIWIGSKGAHTPCHIDTYGFNLVCQIFGRKLWILFPPEQNLHPSRIPYEESSIYSELNFFSPIVKDFQGISNAHILILEPGDVLYVPHGWWHYVENLETAISINVWLPTPEDDSERIKEALVQFFVKQVCDFSTTEMQRIILNPNMEQIVKEDPKNSFDLISRTTQIYKRESNTNVKKLKKLSEEENNDLKAHKDVFIDSNCIKSVLKSTNKEWMDFLQSQSSRFRNAHHGNDDIDGNMVETQNVLKALTDPEVINLIHNKLLK